MWEVEKSDEVPSGIPSTTCNLY